MAGTNHMCMFLPSLEMDCSCGDPRGCLQVAYSIATLVSVINLYLKVKVLIEQLRYRRAEVDIIEARDKNSATLEKHRHQLLKTRHTLLLIYASMMVGSAEV